MAKSFAADDVKELPWLMQVANFDVVREKFGGSAAMLALHDKIADVLLTATALSAESPGMECSLLISMVLPRCTTPPS